MRSMASILAVAVGIAALSAPSIAGTSAQFKDGDGKVMGTVTAKRRTDNKVIVAILANKPNGWHLNTEYPFKVVLGSATVTKDNAASVSEDGATLVADDPATSGTAKAVFCNGSVCSKPTKVSFAVN